MTTGKRLHVFAVVLWVLAGLQLVVAPVVTWNLWYAAQQTVHPVVAATMINTAWRAFEGGLYEAAELAAAGFVIQILDAIRYALAKVD